MISVAPFVVPGGERVAPDVSGEFAKVGGWLCQMWAAVVPDEGERVCKKWAAIVLEGVGEFAKFGRLVEPEAGEGRV